MSSRIIPAVLFLLIALSIFPMDVRGESSKICLTMIVRNEEKIIERCLDSVKPIVDCISICDTGSTDHTVQLIEQYMKKNKIPGKIHKHEWKNFGFNRTLASQAAQKTLKDLGFPLENTFLLFMDADMMLEVGPEFRKDNLKEDSFSIVQKNKSMSYYNTRLVRASLPWKSIGVTHEYWSCEKPCKESHLQTLTIDDRDDGGCKADKFDRDIKLLTQGLEQEPQNERYMFYLAQSYKCLHNYPNAIKWYQARIQKGGWNEEVWYSKFMTGQCHESMGQWNEALQYYLDAYEFLPDRAEPLQHISQYYRLRNQHNLTYLFANQGSQIPYPHHLNLFISHPVYEYLLDEDISVSAFYTPFKEKGYAAANRLMLKKNIPSHIRDQAYRNMLYYVENLKNAQFKPVEINLPAIREGLSARYNPMNPSIRKTNSGYEVICRTVNYIQIGAQHFKSLDLSDPTNLIRTRNYLVQYDPDFKLLSQQEIIEDLPRVKNNVTYTTGLEDCRIFRFKNSTWFTCTTPDTNPSGQLQISLCKLSDHQSGPIVKVEKLIPLFGPDPKRCEKNWLPFIKDDQIHMIYSYNPFVINKFEIDIEKGQLIRQTTFRNQQPKYDFSRFSGSASPIEFDDGYLFLVHEMVYEDSQRNYMHRLVYLDKDFNFKKLSKPFTYMHKGIEYCCGMTVDHAAKNLVMPIGIEDREAYLCIVDLDTVRSLLEPLP